MVLRENYAAEHQRCDVTLNDQNNSWTQVWRCSVLNCLDISLSESNMPRLVISNFLISVWSSSISVTTFYCIRVPVVRVSNNQDATLSQGGPRDAPYSIQVLWKNLRVPGMPTANFPDILMDLFRSIRKKSCGSGSVDNRVRSPHTVYAACRVMLGFPATTY